MRALAEYIMRGRKEATLVVAIASAVPLLFLLAAAAVALVVLRRGLSESLPVIGWGILPAVAWVFMGDITPLLVILGSVALAVLLRERASWLQVLMAVVPLSLLYTLVLMFVLQEPMAELVAQLEADLPEVLSANGLDESVQLMVISLLKPLLTGSFGEFNGLMVLIALMIGRSWQAGLYNPGGFRAEFHQLRLSPVVAAMFWLLFLGTLNLGQLAIMAPIATLPLLIAGLAMLHGVVGLRQMGVQWLVVVYVLLAVAAQVVYPLIMVLALIDSLFDFRSRLAPASGPRDDNDPNGQD